MENKLNEVSLDTLCGALAYAVGVDAPKQSAPADTRLTEYVDAAFGGKKADRLFMFNPDAIGQWVYEKYAFQLREAIARTDLALPFCTVMPSVTPVCFGTMYTGVQPAVHGIQRYTKPVLKIETLFDCLVRAGKKVAIVAIKKCSIAMIFLEREMDYFIYPTEEEVNAKAAELILKDEYDCIVVYNGNYDARMHKSGPESIDALGELRQNAAAFGAYSVMIEEHWKKHNTLVGFAMDHGCHEIDGECGAHGLDMPDDLNIVHLYKAYPAAE